MLMANEPPPEVQRAAAIVDAWLKGQPGVLSSGTPQPQPRAETAAEKFRRMRLAEFDQSQMPARK
jgi:hypothetical protein